MIYGGISFKSENNKKIETAIIFEIFMQKCAKINIDKLIREVFFDENW